MKKWKAYRMLRELYFSIVRTIRRILLKSKEADMKRNNYIIELNHPKVSFFLPYYSTDLIQMSIAFDKSYYEIDYLKYVCEEWNNGCIGKAVKGRAVLDIGSNIGNHSLFFLLECGAAFAYVFEPIKDTFSIMKKNMEVNALIDKVSLYNVGVGVCEGGSETRAQIKGYNRSNTGGASLILDSTGDIPIVAIDNLDIDKEITLIKVDTEGFEIDVVKGMMETIKRFRPYIMIEIQPQNYKLLNDILNNLGYLYEQYDECNYLYYYKG